MPTLHNTYIKYIRMLVAKYGFGPSVDFAAQEFGPSVDFVEQTSESRPHSPDILLALALHVR